MPEDTDISVKKRTTAVQKRLSMHAKHVQFGCHIPSTNPKSRYHLRPSFQQENPASQQQ